MALQAFEWQDIRTFARGPSRRDGLPGTSWAGRPTLNFLSLLLVGILLSLSLAPGSSSNGSAIEPGRGGLVLVARAVHDSNLARAGGDPWERDYRYDAESAKYDYRGFEDLVVYVRGPGVPAGGRAVEVAFGEKGFDRPLAAAGRGDVLRLANGTSRTLASYEVNSETGEEFRGWPEVPPGGSFDWTPAGAGPVEVFAAGVETASLVVYVEAGGAASVLSSGARWELTLPTGAYEAGGWHPTLPASSRPVEVREGERAEVEVLFSVDALSEGAGAP